MNDDPVAGAEPDAGARATVPKPGSRRSALVEAAVTELTRAGRPLTLAELARAVLHVESGSISAATRALQPLLAADQRLGSMDAGHWGLASWRGRDQPLNEVDFVIFDVETNGGRGGRHRVLEIGAHRIRDGKLLARFDSLAGGVRRVSKFVTRYTGITNEMLAGALPVEEVIEDFRAFQDGAVLVAHNLPTDLGYLNRESIWAGRPLFPGDGLDTMELLLALLPEADGSGLTRALEIAGIEAEPKHRALPDAELTTKLFAFLLTRATERDVTRLDELRELAASGGPEGPMPRRARELARWASRNLPPAPGVYIFRDQRDRPLYVGKSVSLQRRVRSHFTASSGFVRRWDGMLESIERIDWEVTGSELTALLREAELIDSLQPLHNVQRRRRAGSRYVHVGPPASAAVHAAATVRDDEGDYLGPFRTSRDARLAGQAARRIFDLPSVRATDKRVPAWRRHAAVVFLSHGLEAAVSAVSQADAPQNEVESALRRLRRTRVVRRPLPGGLGGERVVLAEPGAEPWQVELALIAAGRLVTRRVLDRPRRADVRAALRELIAIEPAPDLEPSGTMRNLVLAWLHTRSAARDVVPLDGEASPSRLVDRLWERVRWLTLD